MLIIILEEASKWLIGIRLHVLTSQKDITHMKESHMLVVKMQTEQDGVLHSKTLFKELKMESGPSM